MVLSLRKHYFIFLKENMKLAYSCVKNAVEDEAGKIIHFEVDDYSDFQDMMNFDIISTGMDNEDTVNDLGIRMYWIYDDIYNQK